MVLLGAFAMTPAAGPKVELKNDHNGQNLIADAIKFERDAYASGGEMVIDNTDAGASQVGTWYNNTYAGGGGYIGSNYVANNGGTGANVFKWTPTLAAASRWRIYARWIQFTNHATDAKYRVFHVGGETVITVNQKQDGSRWMALGDFDLAPGASHRVEIRDDGNGYVIADAVLFVKLADSKFVAADAVRFIKNDAEALLYVHADHLGRPRKMTNTARQVVWDAQYAPFGEEHALAGAGFNDERFPGQLWDEETGFHYNYFRDYDPRMGRYLQSDPIGLRGGLNTYGYVDGNPVNAIDPTGEFGRIPGPKNCLKWLFRWCIKWEQRFPEPPPPEPKPEPPKSPMPDVARGGWDPAWSPGDCLPGDPSHMQVAFDPDCILGGGAGGGGQSAKGGGKKPSGPPPRPTSPNQMNDQIHKGQAPPGLERAERGNPVHNEQPHVHFNDGRALNQDGTWKHGSGGVTGKQKKWLQQNGWSPPK